MKVHVILDEDDQVVGVVSDKKNINTGLVTGLEVLEFELDDMPQLNPMDRPWVVYFNGADVDRPQVWPIKHGFPEKSGPEAFPEGIQFVVYAKHAGEATNKACNRLHFDSWDIAVAEWEQMQ